MSTELRVGLVFASRGIGGAERSMLRLMQRAHPGVFTCRVIVPAAENAALRAAAGAIGVPYHALPAWSPWALQRLLRAHPVDVLYVFGRFRVAAWALAARLAGVRCVVAAERSAANRRSDRLARRLDRRLVTAYLANSEAAARNLRAIVGAGGPPVLVAPNGIELDARYGMDAAAVQDGALLCVGNISPNKGHAVLLEAVRLLRARHPGLRATLVGRDFTGGRFFAEAAARGLGDAYHAVGFVDDVRPFLERAAVVVLPSLKREGMPTSLLEAMSAGVPVVASNVGGVGEIVEHERTGLLVAPGDAAGLASAISRLLEGGVMRERLAARARRHVQQHHSLASMLEGHRTAFQAARAIAGPARHGADQGSATRVVHVTTAAVSLRYLLLGQLAAIRDRGYDVAGLSSPGEDAAALAAQGIPHLPVSMTRRLTPVADLRALVQLWRTLRARRFTIVHTHNPKPGLLGQLAARAAGVPVVVNTLHGFYFHDGMRPWARRFYVTLERLAARCSDVILSQNEEDVATAVRERIAPPDRIKHLGNGIDLARFDPARLPSDTRRRVRESLGIAPDAPVIGFVGRLVAEKGVPELLQAARLVLRDVPAARFLLVGSVDAEKADHLTPAAARSLGIAAACVFAGQRQDMPELYRVMDVCALPSHREGFPRGPMEAAAMRVPCVVTDVRGCRQAVVHGVNGLLVPLRDPAALAEAILALVSDPVLARRLGEQGRRRAIEEFDEQRVFARVLAEYERLLERKGLAGRIPVPFASLPRAASR